MEHLPSMDLIAFIVFRKLDEISHELLLEIGFCDYTH
jgi:hypothetical protein